MRVLFHRYYICQAGETIGKARVDPHRSIFSINVHEAQYKHLNGAPKNTVRERGSAWKPLYIVTHRTLQKVAVRF